MSADSPSQLIDARIEELGDGREKTLARYGHEGGKIDEGALKALVSAAVALNTSSAAQ